MKLWHVAQWGNEKDGPNGWDTQCIVSAPDMEQAIKKAEFYFSQYGDPLNPYRGGKADAIYLMGNDDRPDCEPQLVVRIWIAFADNLMHYPSWHRRYWDNDKWEDVKTLYGE